MKKSKKVISLFLVTIMVLGLTACGGNPPTSSNEETHRPPYEKPVQQNTDWTDTDGDFKFEATDWEGPKGYTIVVPAGNESARDTAEILQAYFKATAKVDLPIVTDKTAEKDKEILVGKTKRNQSDKSLGEADVKVSVNGKKLVFDAGHDVTVNSAVEKFCRLDYQSGKANTFAVTTDFSTKTFLDGYEYVWGDEFEGDEVDLTKWAFTQQMLGTERTMMSYDRDVLDTEDGRLKLRAIRYFNPEDSKVQFKMPYSTSSERNMNYRYGYCEIRARLPFFKGAWPSFWAISRGCQVATNSGTSKINEYFIEVDVFEVFGAENGEVKSNIHKWYDKDYYNYGEIHGISGTHTQWGAERNVWNAPNLSTMCQEYHTYGWEWTPKELNMFVDGEKIMTYDIVNSYDLYKNMDGFRDPVFIIFNNHVTSTDASTQYGLIDNSLDKLPSEYFIDYFRLYQKKSNGAKIWIDETANVYPNRK